MLMLRAIYLCTNNLKIQSLILKNNSTHTINPLKHKIVNIIQKMNFRDSYLQQTNTIINTTFTHSHKYLKKKIDNLKQILKKLFKISYYPNKYNQC